VNFADSFVSFRNRFISEVIAAHFQMQITVNVALRDGHCWVRLGESMLQNGNMNKCMSTLQTLHN
jgi:hypothetical protein